MPVPTMKDVAREAGVALGTVSKVFNDIPVGESYRRRVMDAAGKLGYQLNSYARGLKTNKTYAVALIIPNVVNPFFSALAQSVCQALTARGYRMMLSITDCDMDVEQRAIQMARQNRVDGVIGLTYNPALVLEEELPFVSFDRYFTSGVPCVASDNFGGGAMAAEKLLELGCQRLLYFRHGSPVAGETDKRGSGFESVCRQRQAAYEKLWLNDDDSPERFREFLSRHCSDGVSEYDGIFCSTDDLAFAIVRMLSEMGLHVPRDVQVIGYDGIPIFVSGKLPCSTIVQPISLMAETAVDLLLRTDRENLPGLVCLPVRYAKGGTTRDDETARDGGTTRDSDETEDSDKIRDGEETGGEAEFPWQANI